MCYKIPSWNEGMNNVIRCTLKCVCLNFINAVICVTNQNGIHKEIKRGLNSGNACCHSVQNLLYLCMLSKNVKIKMYKNVILIVILFGFKTWSLTF
jgi:hypothetical protein